MSNNGHNNLDQEYELTDLFGDALPSEKEDPELERVKKAAAEKAYQYRPAQEQKEISYGVSPRIEDFTDSAHQSMNRLNPGIQLTSVEEEYRRAHANMPGGGTQGDITAYIPEQQAPGVLYGAAASAYSKGMYEPGRGVASQKVNPQTVNPQTVNPQTVNPQPVMTGTAAMEETGYHSKYDYDYDAEESGYIYPGNANGRRQPQMNSMPAAPQMPQAASAVQAMPSIPQGNTPGKADMRDPRLQAVLKQERDLSDAIEAKEKKEREERQKKEKVQRTLILVVMGMIAVLLVAAIILILIPSGEKKPQTEPSSSSVQLQKDQQTYSGIITQIDKSSGTMLVYNADGSGEKSFSVSGSVNINLSTLYVGDMIDVVYDAANKDTLISIMSCSKAATFNGVTGISISGAMVSINQKLYTLDDHLICLYNGVPYSTDKITGSTVFSATVLNGHCYKIEVTSVSTALMLENLGDYIGGEVVITPADAEPITKSITMDTMTVEVPEGSVDVVVRADHKDVYTVRVFVSSGSDNEIHVPDKDRKTGTVVFTCEADSTVTVTVDGKDYATGSGITMEYGTYTGVAKANGYKDKDIEFTVSGPYLVVTIKLDEAKAPVTINANISGFTVWVDGAYEATIDSSSGTVMLSEGVHWIVCMKDGYTDQGVTVVVSSDGAAQSVNLGGFMPLPEESSEESSESSENSSNSSDNSQESSADSQESSQENSSEQGGESSNTHSEESSQTE